MLLGRDDTDGALGILQRLFGVSLDQTLEKSRLAYAGRSNNSDEPRRRGLVGSAVGEGDMELLFFDVLASRGLSGKFSGVRNGETVAKGQYGRLVAFARRWRPTPWDWNLLPCQSRRVRWSRV